MYKTETEREKQREIDTFIFRHHDFYVMPRTYAERHFVRHIMAFKKYCRGERIHPRSGFWSLERIGNLSAWILPGHVCYQLSETCGVDFTSGTDQMAADLYSDLYPDCESFYSAQVYMTWSCAEEQPVFFLMEEREWGSEPVEKEVWYAEYDSRSPGPKVFNMKKYPVSQAPRSSEDWFYDGPIKRYRTRCALSLESNANILAKQKEERLYEKIFPGPNGHKN